jgi:maleate cis-trans isomerase
MGWRGHLGKIAPSPAAGRVIREFYEVVPEGIDITVASLLVQKVEKKEMDDMMGMVNRSAEVLAEKGVDAIYLGGVPPIVMKHPGYDLEVCDQIKRVSGLPASTDMTGVMDAFRALGLKRLVMATPFEGWVNDLIKKYVAPAGFDIVHMDGLPLKSGSERKALPVHIEYTFTRQVFRECLEDVDGIYIPCGGWGTVHNVARMEQDFGKPVVTWFNAMIWWFLTTTGVRAPIHGFGKLLESIGADQPGIKEIRQP